MAADREDSKKTDRKDQIQGIRLNKYLSSAGICSRREADKYIEEGNVKIDGRVAQMGERVFPGERVTCLGHPVGKKKEDRVLLAFHKPKGVVCTTSQRDKNNIIAYIGYEKRIFPIGRLDKSSEGLILLTNEGELSDQILRGSNYHEKEYVVTLNMEITDEDLQKLREGVPILDTVTRPCRVFRLRANVFRIILTQGLNRQIRRMCEYLGYRVVYLKRIRVMNILLDGIPKGEYREVTKEEREELERLLKEDQGKRQTVWQASRKKEYPGRERREKKQEEGAGRYGKTGKAEGAGRAFK